MKTLRFIVDPLNPGTAPAVAALDAAATVLRAGGLVALPTETVYGLGANALDAAAVGRIFAAKQRPAWDPVIVHIAPPDNPDDERDQMLEGLVAEVPEAARRLIQAFWPGPLTLLLPRTRAVPDAVTAGRPLVGVRMPAHPVALALIRRAGLPVAAPSANLFGHISPTTADHVLADLDGRIDAVLDAGPTDHGVESTVLDPCRSPMVIYRPGAVTAEQIREVAGAVEVFKESAAQMEMPAEGLRAAEVGLPAPGVGLRHYAPKARLIAIDAPFPELAGRLQKAAKEFAGERIGMLLPAGMAIPGVEPLHHVCAWGRWDAPEEMARTLYAGLRELDAHGCTVILCPLPPETGIGTAIRDRLRKAGILKQG